MAASMNNVLLKSNLRNRLRKVVIGSYGIFALSIPHHWFSTESSSSDDEATSTTISKKEEKFNSKLSALLSSIKIEPSIPPEKSTITMNLAKPRDRRPNKKKVDQPKQDSSVTSSVKIDDKLVTAAKAVASSLDGDKQIIESELLQALKVHAEETEDAKSVSTRDVSKVFAGMKVDRKRKTTTDWSRHPHETLHPQALQEMNDIQAITEPQQRRIPVSFNNRVNLHKSLPLGIFDTPVENIKTDFPKNEIWDKLSEHELQLLVKHPVRNGFEEMIRWTEEGKLWIFPVDNEYGLEEKNVSFHEHVFLDHLLDGFPEKGPIRHFMELVITGLSKNPYITVERKKEHVEWYRTFFKDKKEVLREADALIN